MLPFLCLEYLIYRNCVGEVATNLHISALSLPSGNEHAARDGEVGAWRPRWCRRRTEIAADTQVRAMSQPRRDFVPQGTQAIMPVARVSVPQLPVGRGEAACHGGTGSVTQVCSSLISIYLFIRFSFIYLLIPFFIYVIIFKNHQFSLSYILLYNYGLLFSKF
jgi:hypothetical protein